MLGLASEKVPQRGTFLNHSSEHSLPRCPGRKSFGLALASGTQPPTAPSVCPSVPWAPAKPCPRCSQNILEAHIPPRLCPSFQPGWPAPFALLDKGLPHSVMQQEGPLLVSLAAGLASSWSSGCGPRQGQQGLGGRGLNPGKGFWGHRSLDHAAGPGCVQDSLGPQWFTCLQPPPRQLL